MLKKLFKHRTVSVLCVLSLVCVIGSSLRAYVALRGIQTPLIIHFDDLRGITQTGKLGTLMAVGVFGLIVVCLNSVIAFELEERARFFGKFVAVFTFAFAVLLFIGFTAILGVN